MKTQLTDSNRTLLAVLIGQRYASRYRGSLREIFQSTALPLKARELLLAALELTKRCLEEELQHSPALASPNSVRQFLLTHYVAHEREAFSCLFLDNRHCLVAFEELFLGTIDGASVHPREVVKRALQVNAAAVILAHNHPSGVAEPSQADELITRRLQDGLALVDIRVLDHVIVGGTSVVSFAERGLI